MNVRLAVSHDAPAVTALLEQAALPTVGVAEHLHEFVVAEDDEGVVGVIGRETYGDVALLRSAVVHERARGSGIGAQLVHALEAAAREAQVRALVLLTTTADQWFPRFGYEVITRDAVPDALLASAEFRGACPASAIVMRKRL